MKDKKVRESKYFDSFGFPLLYGLYAGSVVRNDNFAFSSSFWFENFISSHGVNVNIDLVKFLVQTSQISASADHKFHM